MIKRIAKNIIARLQKAQRRLNKQPIEKILSDLERLPIKKGDNIFVHTALSPLGYIEGDLNLIVEWFIEKVGKDGHVFMPAFSSNGYSCDYLAQKPVFNVKETKSLMGVITELFRNRKDVERSIHPTHSVLVWGNRKEEFISGHHKDILPFGEMSPFYKFLQLPNSKVVGLGLTIFSMTVFRVYETINKQSYPLQVFLDKEFEVSYVDANGESGTMKTLAHNPEVSGLRRNMLFENKLLKLGKLKPCTIGKSTSHVLDTTNFLDFMDQNFKEDNLPYLGYYKDFHVDKVDENRLFVQLS